MAEEQGAGEPIESRNWPALQVVYDELKWRVEMQNDQIRSLDQKSNIGLGVSSAIVAFLAFARQKGLEGTESLSHLEYMLLGSAATVFIIVVCAWHEGGKIRPYQLTPEPVPLVDKLLHESEEFAKAAISDSRAKDIEANNVVIAQRTMWIKVQSYSIVALLVLTLGLILGPL